MLLDTVPTRYKISAIRIRNEDVAGFSNVSALLGSSISTCVLRWTCFCVALEMIVVLALFHFANGSTYSLYLSLISV